MRRALLPLVVLTAVLVPVTAPHAQPEPSEPAAASKVKKCKRTQVSVRVGKRGRVCKPVGRFIPRPRPGDSRRIGVVGALSLDLGRVGKKRIASLDSVLGRRRAAGVRRRLLRMLPKLLARIDRGSGARAAASDCGRTGPDFRGKMSGGSVGLVDGNGQMTAPAGGGMRVRVTFPAGTCNRYEVPACPTAAGVLDGRAERPREIHVLIYDGDTLVFNQSYRTTARARLHGQVADDAKLDGLDVDDAVSYRVSTGGEAAGGHSLIDATIARSARVDMRTGRYEPSEAAVRLLLRVNGRSIGEAEELRTASDLARRFAADFSALVDTAIAIYRGAERDWNDHPNSCAKVDFSPAPGTHPVARGASGSLTATVSATRGGSPPRARWTLSGPVNATFSPLASSANPFTPSYTVASSGSGTEVRGSFRATSRAGVAEAVWTQPIRGLPRQISGSWHNVVQSEGLHFDVTFNGTFVGMPSSSPSIKGDYQLTSGTGTWQVSGMDGGCNVSGSGPFTVAGGAILLTTPGSATAGPPFSYLIQTQSSQEGTTTYTYSGCPDPGDDGPRVMPVPFSGLNLSGTTPDGYHYDGSRSDSSLDYSSQETWTFTGTP